MRNFRILLFCGYFMMLIGSQFQFSGCASIQYPTGGPRDTIAPKVEGEKPKNLTTNFKGSEVSVELNEFFKIENEFKEVSVSPAMEKSPVLKVKKKTLHIKFQEPLQDSTTYTINFGNGIVDYNEGNVLKNYMYVLSTGPKIDSLSISGTVINTLSKEPVLNATVFLLPTRQDTLFGKSRASIFTTTDSSGRYQLKYLRSNRYNIYALKEEGGDRIYNSTNEQVGFLGSSIDLIKDTAGINLELFQEEPFTFRLLDRKIEKDARLTFILNQKLEKPSIQILQNAQLDQGKMVEFNRTNDTAFVWLPTMEFDSINVVIQNNGKGLDTVTLRRGKRDNYNRELLITSTISSGKLKPGSELQLSLSAPVRSIDAKQFTLLQDSIAVTGLRIGRDSTSSRKINFRYPWKAEKNYILKIGENAFTGIFGGGNKATDLKFTRDVEENYGYLTLKIGVPDTVSAYVVQLLGVKNSVLSEHPLSRNTTLNFANLAVGKYYIRIVYDDNKNRKWDTGNVKERKQPESIWNHPGEISLRANFDLEEKIAIPKRQ